MYAVDFYFQLYCSSSEDCAVATFHTSFLFQSWVPHSFLMYQVDIYVAHTLHSTPTQTHTHTQISDMRKKTENRKVKKSCSSRARDSAERTRRESRSSSFFNRKYGRNPWTCVSRKHHRFWHREKGNIFKWISLHKAVFPSTSEPNHCPKHRDSFAKFSDFSGQHIHLFLSRYFSWNWKKMVFMTLLHKT